MVLSASMYITPPGNGELSDEDSGDQDGGREGGGGNTQHEPATTFC